MLRDPAKLMVVARAKVNGLLVVAECAIEMLKEHRVSCVRRIGFKEPFQGHPAQRQQITCAAVAIVIWPEAKPMPEPLLGLVEIPQIR